MKINHIDSGGQEEADGEMVMALLAQRVLFLAWYIVYQNHYTKRPMQKGIRTRKSCRKSEEMEHLLPPLKQIKVV